jgi:hypothetical protein
MMAVRSGHCLAERKSVSKTFIVMQILILLFLLILILPFPTDSILNRFLMQPVR